jgi:2-C-methyl-D-erythritol 4-phosphate cytidylyltransferase
MHVTAIIPSAGEGRRLRGPVAKQFRRLDGVPLLVWTLRGLAASRVVDRMILVVPPGEEGRCRDTILTPFAAAVDAIVPGGADRQASVAAGIEAAGRDTDLLLVHDAVRPLVTADTVRAAVAAAALHGAAVAAVPVTDTIKLADAGGAVETTLPRGRLWAAQTPQVFRAALLRAAHEKAAADGFRSTDDSALVERLPHPVRLVPGSPENLKVTTPQDLLLAEEILKKRMANDQ